VMTTPELSDPDLRQIVSRERARLQ
jgi:hypothetical protein